MNKTGYYKQDWFIALLIGAAFAAAYLTSARWLERVELIAYDLAVKATHRTPGASDQIAIVAIDDKSLADIGSWPWSRRVIAETVERIGKAEPRAVGVLLDFSEPQIDPGLLSVRDIRSRLVDMKVPKQAGRVVGEVRALLSQAERELDADRTLAQALGPTPRLHLPLWVRSNEPLATAAPEYVRGHRLANVATPINNVPTQLFNAEFRAPLETFARHATGIGHLSFPVDSDGRSRGLHTVLRNNADLYPSLAILLAASTSHLDGRHIEFDATNGLLLGKLTVPVDPAGKTRLGFYAPANGNEYVFPTYSLSDVRDGKVASTVFTNKIVLLGLTAPGIGTNYATPITDEIARASIPELTANAIASILNDDFYQKPDWSVWAEPAIAAALLLYLTVVVPRLHGKIAALVSLLLLFGLIGAEQFLMVTQRQWLATMSPALLLLAGHFAIVAKRFVFGERGKMEIDSAHTNRMLGLALQSQGQLDMAMDKFRKLPVDDSVLDLIYHLALDFERKRQFLKAAAAYDYILANRRGFRDCEERKKRATQADQGLALSKTMILDGAEKPTLGRYHLERELGRGEMGIVYLGLDPKINRRVAIKTMALSPEMEAKNLGNLRERFFREAETAGRLHHPNIVTIYDVGEEQDLAYIAMEYLEGKEIATYIKPDQPLPFDWILDVAVKIADALAYAHRHDVVHRDIKPSNIVYNETTGSVKAMDFGIARIVAANRTKTGLVLGTPSYMSPEQITGKRVDGRSDLYAFGSMLFEMVAGDTPYDGDTYANLMHQIINAPVPDIRKARPDTPPALAAIIKRLLQKQVTKRYQTGDELKRDLEQCRSGLGETAAKA